MKSFFSSVSLLVLAALVSPASLLADGKDLEGKWESEWEGSGVKIVNEYTISEKSFSQTTIATRDGESVKTTIKSSASLGDKDLIIDEDVNKTKYLGNFPVTSVIFKGRFDHSLSEDKQRLTISSNQTFYVEQNGRVVRIDGIKLKLKRKKETSK